MMHRLENMHYICILYGKCEGTSMLLQYYVMCYA